MGLSAKVGSFNTGTGAVGSTVVVNDVGFQPKVIFFWWNGRTGTTDASGRANHQRGFGVGVSSSDRRYATSLSQDTPTSMVTNTMQGNAQCIGITTTADAIDGLMDVQSMDAGGFTLVVDDVFTASYRVHYLALGGTDITNVTTGQFTGNAAGGTGNQDITTVGFQPDFVMIFGTGQTTANNTVRADSRIMLGMATGSNGASGVWSGGSNDGAANAQSMAYSKSAEIIAHLNAAVTSTEDRASFTGFLSNGFNINWSEVTTGGSVNFFVAIKGGRYTVGNFLTRTDGNAIPETGVGFSPKGVLLISATRAESTADTATDDDEWSMGAFTSTTARVSMSMSDDDAAATAVVGTGVSHDEAYQNLNATTGAVEGEMDVQSVDADGFTMIMDDTDPVAAFVLYAAFGQAPQTQTVSGGITPSGSIFKDGRKTLAGGNTPSGAISKSSTKTFEGSITPAGNLLKQVQKILSGAISSIVGTLSTARGYIRSFDGSITPSGATTKTTNKPVSGTLTSSGSLLKSIGKLLSGALTFAGELVGDFISGGETFFQELSGAITPTGALTKSIAKLFSGTLTSSGTLTASALFAKVLAGALTLSGTISKQADKVLTGTVTSSGTLAKSVSKFFAGTLTWAGSLGTQLITGGQTFFQDVSGSLTPAGNVLKSTAKAFAGTLTSAGTILKTALKNLLGSITPDGVISRLSTKTFTGVLTSAGSLNKSINKSLSGILSAINGALSKQTGKSFSGNVTPTGSISTIRLFIMILEGTLILTGTVSKNVFKNLTGNISPSGTLNKFIQKTFSGTLSFVGNLISLFGVVDVVTKVYLLGSRITTVAMEGVRNRIVNLRGKRKNKENMTGSREDIN